MRHSTLAVGLLALTSVTACSSSAGSSDGAQPPSASAASTARASSSARPAPSSTAPRPAPSSTAAGPAPSSSTAEPAASPAGPPRAVAGAVAGSSQVAAAVKAFYGRYVSDPGNADLAAYLTTAAAARLFATVGGDSDPVLCAQNTPVSLSFAPPLVRDAEATVAVTTHWAGGTTSGPITVTVTLPDILISGISCPTG